MSLKYPESWSDCGMDWSDPDPLNVSYHYAISLAIEERLKAICAGNQSPYHKSFTATNVMKNMILSADLFNSYLSKLRAIISYAFNSEYFLNMRGTYQDYTFDPYVSHNGFLYDQYLGREPVWFQNVSRGMTLAQMKQVMIQIKSILDYTYLFPPAIASDTLYDGDNHIVMHRYGDGYGHFPYDYEFPPNATNLDKANTIKEELFKRYNKVVEEDAVKQEGHTWVCRYNCTSYSWGNYSHTGTAFPYHVNALSPYVRSFCKPKLLGILTVEENSSFPFFDYETGLLPGEKRLLNYGQIIKNEKMECPIKFNQYAPLDDPNFYTNNESGRDWEFGAIFTIIYAFDYNCDGGFKFRPDSEN